MDVKIEENTKMSSEIDQFSETVEELLTMRDNLQKLVEEISEDSKQIKLELEKSLDANHSKDEKIRELENKIQIAEKEEGLNDLLQGQNEKLLEQGKELTRENEKLLAELEFAQTESETFKEEIEELTQAMKAMKVKFAHVSTILGDDKHSTHNGPSPVFRPVKLEVWINKFYIKSRLHLYYDITFCRIRCQDFFGK